MILGIDIVFSNLTLPPSNTPLEHSRYVTEKIHNLVTAFSQRASRVKAQITQPPTPSTELSDGGEEQQKPRHRLESIAGEASRSPTPTDLVGVSSRKVWFLRKARACKKALTQLGGLEPQSTLYISWLFIVSVIFFFNAWVIPLRSVFSEYQNADNLAYWLAADYLCDFIYVLDIVLKSRVKYIDNGFWVGTPSLMRKHYMASKNFIVSYLRDILDITAAFKAKGLSWKAEARDSDSIRAQLHIYHIAPSAVTWTHLFPTNDCIMKQTYRILPIHPSFSPSLIGYEMRH
ncbi:cyclic nucleotide gated channel beta 1 [Halocaridina rubra]|uniref:Cyclic nucleotide gated channel beta 1 n=1 Tax=Halocaridina rubra TaxID=373956 RepID=A0AAN9AC47_HALRR